MARDEVIVPATLEDYLAIYGKPPPRSFQGFVVRKNDEPVAVAGIYLENGAAVVFSQIEKPVSKKTILATAYRVLAIACAKRLTLIAQASSDIPTSESFIRHFGFSPMPGQPGVFRWQA